MTRPLLFSTFSSRILLLGMALIVLPRLAGAQALDVTSPTQNQQICLGTSVPVTAAIQNPDSIGRTLLLRIEITNIVTGISVYVATDTSVSVGPGSNRSLTLPSYLTDPNKLSQLGTFTVLASLTSLDSALQPIPNWPYQVADRYIIFGIRTMTTPFVDFGNNYSRTGAGAIDIPFQIGWVNQGATVVEGDNAVWEAPPPRDESGYGADSLHSPLIRLDRIGIFGDAYGGAVVGDTLASFPFNLSGFTKAQLTFDFMRNGRALYPGLWDFEELTGPESPITDVNGNVLRPGDSLLLEFASPSSSPCDAGATSWREVLGIGGGHDLSFHTAYVTIEPNKLSVHFGESPSTVVTNIGDNYLASQFRFRFRLKASDHGGSLVQDDADPFFIDNVHLQRLSLPEIEVMWGRVVTPYTVLPYSATAALPVYVKLKSYGAGGAMNVPIRVTIEDTLGVPYYDQTIMVDRLPASGDTVVQFPNWNAQSAPMPGRYIVRARIGTAGYDEYSEDNETYSQFFLNSKIRESDLPPGDRGEMAYDDAGIDPLPDAGNDIPFLTKVTGNGIGFNNSSGSYAVKFTLPRRDTIYGTRIFFSNGNSSPDAIRISLNTDDSEHAVPGDTLRQESTQTEFQDVRRGGFFNQFWPYYFPKPIVVEPGSYWIVVSQLSLDNMMLGGDLSRGGASVAVADVFQPQLPPIYGDPFGTQWSPVNNNGDVSRSFAVQSPVSAGWQPWMPQSGFWPVGGNREAVPVSPRLTAPQAGGGAYLPMIRLMVGQATPLSSVASNTYGTGLQVYPNPTSFASGPLTCSLSMDRPAYGSVLVYDVMGRIVRHLARQNFTEGTSMLTWNGTDDRGTVVTGGSYILRFISDRYSASSNVAVVR